MAKWYHIPTLSRMSEGEYQANIQGINIVFGAVLGFVLADANDLPQLDFAIVLFLSATVVVSILYLAHSEYKLVYGAITTFLVFMLPQALEEPLGISAIPQLQPTLAVWTVMIIIVELIPRTKTSTEDPSNKKESDT